MGFIVIDGNADRKILGNNWEYDDEYDGWGLYPYGAHGGGAYYGWELEQARPEGRYGDWCAMLADHIVSYDYINVVHLVGGMTEFSGGLAVNSLDDGCDFIFGMVYNAGGTSRRYGPNVEVDGDGSFVLRRSKTTSTSTEILQASDNSSRMTMWGWHYITFQFVCEGLGTDWIKVWMDGELQIDFSGTALNVSGPLEYLNVPHTVSAFDDLWLRDDTSVIAEPVIPAIFPDGAGTDTECASIGSANNWENVDEFEQDFHSSYNLVDTGEKDSFNMGSLSTQVSAGVVHALCARFFVWGDAGNALQLRPYVIVNSTKYNGTAQAVTEGYWKYIQEIWEVNPDTSVAWTISDIDAVEIGYEAV